MGMSIFLRKRYDINYFRNIMVNAINTGAGTRCLLCSGFFQENRGNDTYRASLENNFAQVLASRNISLVTVGIYTNFWKPSYDNFIHNLRNQGVNLQAKIKTGLKWHAKIFILSDDTRPILGIIGSSNITRPAFGITKPFNYECDVILWLKSVDPINILLETILEKIVDPTEVIRAHYDDKLNHSLSIEERLKRLEKEVLSQNLIDL